ncbi:MAG TPA: hypothetical protein VFL63_12300 [Rhodanobacteraceae bacterium]|nr:hypothetical protein [Rhodanobacteraceae bacterium]
MQNCRAAHLYHLRYTLRFATQPARCLALRPGAQRRPYHQRYNQALARTP